jgi:hypothetical protein
VVLSGVIWDSKKTQKHCIMVLCTISVTSGFESTYEPDVTEIAHKHSVSPKLRARFFVSQKITDAGFLVSFAVLF